MDDIYCDLENYNDVNALDELRNENTQLKFRIEKYASDMDKLQKEFDKVSSEFKILELNYSSLLKTAKAEIQRKTQIICNLNAEKDMMVLNSIQNSNKSILNIRRSLFRDKTHNYNLRMMKKDKEFDCSKTNRKDLKKFDFEKESSRKNEIRVPSVETMTSVSTDECVEKKLEKSDTYEKNSEIKENITKPKSRAQSIRNRRKSMPILGKQLPRFSSDEENDNSANETKKKDRYSKDEKSRRNPVRNYSEKVIHKISETSGIDEKYSSYHESSRETYYRGKSSRQSDKHRSIRDKYEQSERPRRPFSPERSNRKAPRDQSAEYYRDRDYRRHRVLESPPPDRLEVQKRNRRFNYERENQLEDKHCSLYKKHSVPMKHKLLIDYEEPTSKRMKTHSLNRNLGDERKQNKHLTDNTIPSRITDPLELTSCHSPEYIDLETVTTVKKIVSTADIQPEDPSLKIQKYERKQNKHVTENAILSRITEPLEMTSCQSPEYIDPETVTPVKEIVSTTDIQPEDPSLISQKYERKQNKHVTEKAIPCRITDPLELTPCQSPDYIDPETVTPVREIVSTADIPPKDPRLKSIKYFKQNENDKVLVCTVTGRNVELKAIDSSTWDIERVAVPEALKCPLQYKDECMQRVDDNVDKPMSSMTTESGEIHSDTDSYFNDIYEEEKQRVRDLNIRDFYEKETNVLDTGKSHKTHNAKPTCDNTKQLDMPLTEYVIDNAKQENKSDTKITIKLLSKKETENSIKQINSEHEHREVTQYSGEEKILSCRGIVEGDLALSDETCDNIDSQIKVKCRTRSQHIKLKNKCSNNTTAPNVQDRNSKERDTSSLNQEEKAKEQLVKRIKKAKSKRKSHKSKDKSTALLNTENMTIDEHQKAKKETGQIKEKFTDLFGDSCSLITPEDLGISVMPVNKYDPLFEDALDANDINMKDSIEPQKESYEPLEMKEEISQTSKTKEKKKSKKRNEKRSSVESQEREREKDAHTINCQAVTQEPDVLSMVIISTGVQPQVSREAPLEDKQADINVIKGSGSIQNNEVLTKLQQLQPAALATSTPYKELPLKNILPGTVESSCSSNDSRVLRNEVTPSDLSSNISSQIETDAPDIRIFVRRRKKVFR